MFPNFRTIALAAALLGLAFPVLAADAKYPDRAIKLVAPQEPGSATDKVSRILADALERQWGSPVIVENRPGAGGTIGAEVVARAAPDGYTLLVGGYPSLVVASVTRDDLRYDALHDFSPIGRFAVVPFVFAVHPSVPATTLPELVAYARANPGKLNVGSLGGGTTGMGTALLVAATGIDMTSIEYRGATSAITDLVAGRIDVLFNEISALGVQADAHRVRLLAVAMPKRIAAAPSLPTTAEVGLPSVVVIPWYGLLAPAGLPPDVAAKIDSAFTAARRSPEFQSRITALGYELVDDDPATFARAIATDLRAARTALAPAYAKKP
jgi:tripartite-type tricarboxylate transporter receptor subunit TctC